MNWVNSTLLAVENLTMRFGGLIAVNAFSFSVGRGDITALIGPNGAGKTTVFNERPPRDDGQRRAVPARAHARP
jgi:ABC-type uncharacterized transport system ATPase subunit